MGLPPVAPAAFHCSLASPVAWIQAAWLSCPELPGGRPRLAGRAWGGRSGVCRRTEEFASELWPRQLSGLLVSTGLVSCFP